MRQLTFSAPGKVLVCGEYAVLDGAPAICMAVDRRAHVSVSPADTPHHTVSAPGFLPGSAGFAADAERFSWLAGGTSLDIVEHAWRALRVSAPTSLALELDTRAFVDAGTGRKLGIGSSAALSAALTAALAAVAGQRGTDLLQPALTAHRGLQGPHGSGVDVACCLHGGLIAYRRAKPVQAVRWPPGLAFALLWSGSPASTGDRLARLDTQPSVGSRAALGRAAERAARTWTTGGAAAIVAELRRFADALREFGVDHELGIFDAGHAALADAAGADVAYKPCGAGGGDIGMAVSADPAALRDFVTAAAAGPFTELDMRMDPDGAMQTRDPA